MIQYRPANPHPLLSFRKSSQAIIKGSQQKGFKTTCNTERIVSTTWKLSPSDLTFLWDECQRCFYLKVARNFNRPRTPFPGIFTKIDGLMKTFFEGQSTSHINPGLPPGRVLYGGKWVQSSPISIPGQTNKCFIRGIFDSVVGFEDGTFGVVDFKTSEPKPAHIEFYGRQLHAYTYSLENPAPGKLSLKPISKLGLLVVEPNKMEKSPSGNISYVGNVTWLEVPRNDQAFIGFLGDVMTLLSQPEPPSPAAECELCKYREAARNTGY